MITLSPGAVTQIKKIAEEECLNTRLRVCVRGGGCAGFTYDMFFETQDVSDLDEVFHNDGIDVIVDHVSHQYLDGCTIDFVKQNLTEGFKFLNPNVKATCGCGNSFDVV